MLPSPAPSSPSPPSASAPPRAAPSTTRRLCGRPRAAGSTASRPAGSAPRWAPSPLWAAARRRASGSPRRASAGPRRRSGQYRARAGRRTRRRTTHRGSGGRAGRGSGGERRAAWRTSWNGVLGATAQSSEDLQRFFPSDDGAPASDAQLFAAAAVARARRCCASVSHRCRRRGQAATALDSFHWRCRNAASGSPPRTLRSTSFPRPCPPPRPP